MLAIERTIGPPLSSDAVRRHFSAFGAIADVFVDQDGNRGHVLFEAQSECEAAMGDRHQTTRTPSHVLGDGTVVMLHRRRRAEEEEPDNQPGHRIYVVCSKFVTEQSLCSRFEVFGAVAELKLLRDAQGNSRGCAFVPFRSRACAEAAVKQGNGQQLAGRPIKVMMAERRRPCPFLPSLGLTLPIIPCR